MAAMTVNGLMMITPWAILGAIIVAVCLRLRGRSGRRSGGIESASGPKQDPDGLPPYADESAPEAPPPHADESGPDQPRPGPPSHSRDDTST
jgi:hypothetical protein